MAGTGSGYVLDKAFPVNPAYTGGSVTRFRCVSLGSSGINLNASAATVTVGIVQEEIDATKVATGKAVADVRVSGVSRAFVGAAGVTLGNRVTAGANGGVVATAAGNIVVGIVVGAPTGAIDIGDIVDVLLTPGAIA